MVKHGKAWGKHWKAWESLVQNTQDKAWYSTVPHCKNGTAQYIMVQHGKHREELNSKVSIEQHLTAKYSMYSMVQQGTPQYSMVPHDTA
jgi:hypothetical protein